MRNDLENFVNLIVIKQSSYSVSSPKNSNLRYHSKDTNQPKLDYFEYSDLDHLLFYSIVYNVDV